MGFLNPKSQFATDALANKETKVLETMIFESEAGDAVIVFTDQKHAESYLEGAGWKNEMVVAQLDPIPFIEWLLLCLKDGVKLMAVNPRREEQDSGLRISTLNIEAQLEHAGDHIVQVATRDF